MSGQGGLQAIVFNGKDCRIVFQNMGSRLFHKKCLVGERSIGMRSGDWSMEAMRDRIWRGESFSLVEKPLFLRGREIIVNKTYSPIYDRRNRVTGFLSEGFSRDASKPILEEVAIWLESVRLDDARSAESFPPLTSLEILADARKQLAESLRRFRAPLPALARL